MHPSRMVFWKIFSLAVLVVELTLPLPTDAAAGDPVPGLDVSLEQKPGGNVFCAKVDSTGSFSFENLPPGRYILRFKKVAPLTEQQWESDIVASSLDSRPAWRESSSEVLSQPEIAARMPEERSVDPSLESPQGEPKPVPENHNLTKSNTTGRAPEVEERNAEAYGSAEIHFNADVIRVAGPEPVVVAGIDYSATFVGANILEPSNDEVLHSLEVGGEHLIEIGLDGKLTGKILEKDPEKMPEG